MNFITQYPDKTSAVAAKPGLQITKDDTGKDIAPIPDTSNGMIVTAYSVAPSVAKDGTPIPGVLAAGVFVLDASVVAELNGKPLQLPPGIAYITPIYFGMATPIPGG